MVPHQYVGSLMKAYKQRKTVIPNKQPFTHYIAQIKALRKGRHDDPDEICVIHLGRLCILICQIFRNCGLIHAVECTMSSCIVYVVTCSNSFYLQVNFHINTHFIMYYFYAAADF